MKNKTNALGRLRAGRVDTSGILKDSPKPPEVDEEAMEAAELCFAKSDALVAGVGKLLTDHISGVTWGPEIAIAASIQLLEAARAERQAGRDQYRKAKLP